MTVLVAGIGHRERITYGSNWTAGTDDPFEMFALVEAYANVKRPSKESENVLSIT